MKTETKTKFQAGQEVYWLSPSGFVKGIIKKVHYVEEVFITKQQGEKEEFKKIAAIQSYFCWHNGCAPEYAGQLVLESEIFTDRKSMIDYYAQKEI